MLATFINSWLTNRIKSSILLLLLICITVIACQPTQSAQHSSAGFDLFPNYHATAFNRLRHDFRLPDMGERTEVKRQMKWFTASKTHAKLSENAVKYIYYIHQEVRKRNMPGEIALMPMIESAYNPFAYSHAGAAGLWQIMPGTGTGFGLKQNWWYDGRRDIYASTNAALDYLNYLHKLFHGDWLLAIAAYDSGEGKVMHAVTRNRKDGLPTDFWSLKLPRETRDYVPRLLAVATLIRHPQQYSITLPNIPNKPYFEKVDVGYQVELAQAAKLAGITLKELYKLNPGYNRWATDPSGHYSIVLPIEKVAQFKMRIVELPEAERVKWQQHKVKSGDTLGHIALHYKTSVKTIKNANKLDNHIIHVGQQLVIPSKHHTGGPPNQMMKRVQRIVAKQQRRGPKRIDYTVKKGDHLGRLAARYHVKSAAIQFWNQLNSNTKLKSGQKLVIWQPRRHYIRTHGRSYVVRNGDSLGKIAHRFHTHVARLKHINHLGKYIRPGQRLKV